MGICSGFFRNLGQYRGGDHIDSGYTRVETKDIVISHPKSHFAINRRSSPPKYVIFLEISQSTKQYMRFVTPVDLSWIKEYQEV